MKSLFTTEFVHALFTRHEQPSTKGGASNVKRFDRRYDSEQQEHKASSLKFKFSNQYHFNY